MPGIRTLDPFYKDNFKIIDRQQNKSNKYWVECNYCPGSKLNHRDNRLLQHITDSTLCPNAPINIRVQGLRMLNEKLGGGQKLNEESTKKRKLKTVAMESFFERPIEKEVSDDLDRKLLRCVQLFMVTFNQS